MLYQEIPWVHRLSVAIPSASWAQLQRMMMNDEWMMNERWWMNDDEIWRSNITAKRYKWNQWNQWKVKLAAKVVTPSWTAPLQVGEMQQCHEVLVCFGCRSYKPKVVKKCASFFGISTHTTKTAPFFENNYSRPEWCILVSRDSLSPFLNGLRIWPKQTDRLIVEGERVSPCDDSLWAFLVF